MGKIANRLLAFPGKVFAAMDHHLGRFAEELEEATKGSIHWQDDSGSARQSITAYLVGVQPHDKNYAGNPWATTRVAGFHSERYKNSPWAYRPPENYAPMENEHPTDPDDKVVILTIFVPYGEYLEFGDTTAGTLHGAMEASREDFREAVQKAIAEAVARA